MSRDLLHAKMLKCLETDKDYTPTHAQIHIHTYIEKKAFLRLRANKTPQTNKEEKEEKKVIKFKKNRRKMRQNNRIDFENFLNQGYAK